MQYLTTTEMAEKWNISRRRVAELCRNERSKWRHTQRENLVDSK